MWQSSAQPSIIGLFERVNRLKATDCNAYACANILVLVLTVFCGLFVLCVHIYRTLTVTGTYSTGNFYLTKVLLGSMILDTIWQVSPFMFWQELKYIESSTIFVLRLWLICLCYCSGHMGKQIWGLRTITHSTSWHCGHKKLRKQSLANQKLPLNYKDNFC